MKGFSIIEAMIAITLGTLLVATAGSVYISNKNTFRIQEALSRLQENGRVANYFLNKEIRMAGFQGCAGENFVTMTNNVKDPSKVLLYDTPLYGFEGLAGAFNPNLPTHLTGKVLAGTDAIEIRMAANTGVQLRSDMNKSNNPILVYDRLGVKAGEVVVISNCLVGDIFIAGGDTNATAITHTVTNNLSNDLTTAYTAGAQVMRYIYYAFYVKDSGRTNGDNQPIYALVRQDVLGNEVEIVDGIERMKISYGVDLNSDKTADRYQTAAEVNSDNNWNKVISIKLNLLFATIENVAPRPQSYQFNGVTYTPTDRKLRREWESYITIRNRGLPS
ncbi:Tfp pilus assembly protein PilW (plasmid) [Legionella adelaidensis]|uniref:Tfp pilus assembly protein PilW n=1 Tax=Legionella adelaidensis TaxID=45056 RepID=A0A0W0R3A0_9GAMM|nr:PilW family protein [Legionella adelaidensis]KTC65513.1 Tfp pilus assembly protein PilW [Legionella adelaidensis]VEH84666.1 Tfp pilus assembly protein PilW [Legionella adelaidensis]